MRDGLLQLGRCRSGLATQHHHCRKASVLQSPPDFLDCQLRSAAHFWWSCPKAPPIHVRSHYILLAPRYDLRIANIGLSSGLCRGSAQCAAAGWAPWLSATTTSHPERVQLEAARANAGLVRSTTVEAVLPENQAASISIRLQTISLLKADNWARLPLANDRR